MFDDDDDDDDCHRRIFTEEPKNRRLAKPNGNHSIPFISKYMHNTIKSTVYHKFLGNISSGSSTG